jgi:hypothetical protein
VPGCFFPLIAGYFSGLVFWKCSACHAHWALLPLPHPLFATSLVRNVFVAHSITPHPLLVPAVGSSPRDVGLGLSLFTFCDFGGC